MAGLSGGRVQLVAEVLDVTDATFQASVLERSRVVPVVVDLWAPWCGPCRTLGPILERVIADTRGAVELAKMNVDENPQVSTSFQVQSIPAVYAFKDSKVVDGFIGALPEAQVVAFVTNLSPPPSEADLLAARGDEASLRRALELQADHTGAVLGLAELLLGRNEPDEALALLGRIPETSDSRAVAARARLGKVTPTQDDPAARLEALLARVKDDDGVRQEYLDLLEVLGPQDPRTDKYRRALAAKLF
ncbi:MAG: tetratricopeptide repeat protein [Acidimicrobiales bacterium]